MALVDTGGGTNTITPLPYIIWRGDYDASAIYQPKSVVVWTDGIAYISKRDVAVTNVDPTDTDTWRVFTATGAASSIAWSNVTGKPTTFNAGTLQSVNISATTPTANQFLQYNSGTSTWTPTTYTPDWSAVTGKPTTFTPTSHTHDSADVVSGILGVARIPDLDAAKIITGAIAVARGGTGLSAVGGANTMLGINSGATALEYKTVTAGTGISVVHAANSITINSTLSGTVTSVGLSMPSIFGVGSAVTTAGTLSATFNTQAQNLVFASPYSGGAGAPTFRSLDPTDIPSLNASIIGAGTLPIVRGGTGQVTATAAANALLPSQTANSGKVLSTDGTNTSWIPAGGVGTVTSVAMSIPGTLPFTVSGGPVTASGTFTFAPVSQTQNYFWAAPNGSAGVPTFRALVAADLPSHNHVKADITDFAHDHNSIYYTKTELNTNGGGGAVHYNNVTSKPSQYDANTLQTRAVSSSAPTNGQVLTWNTGTVQWEPSTSSSGTVTSVALALPPIFSVSGSPVATTGTLTAGLATQTANTVWAGPTSGGAATPAFRALDSADIPSLNASVITAGTLPVARGGTGITALGSANQVAGVNSGATALEYKTITAGTGMGVSHATNSITLNAQNTTAQWNANLLQGRTLDSTAPTTGQTIVWNGASWGPSSVADPSPSFATQTDGTTITWDLNNNKVSNATVTLGGNRTLAFSNAVAGATGVLIVKQDATGGRTLTLPGSSKVVNGGAGAWTPTVGANKVDILSFIYDGTNYWWTIGKDYS